MNDEWHIEVDKASCEHCGDLEGPVLVFTDQTSWCQTCADANGELDPPVDLVKQLNNLVDYG